MFALWMFGNQLENIWGSKRFLIYFLLTGLGAALLHISVTQIQIFILESKMSADQIIHVKNIGYECWNEMRLLISQNKGGINNSFFFNYGINSQNTLDLIQLYHTPTVGASGAVFGLLLAFGMLFPNTIIYLYFAIPLKAKYFVIFYGIAELYLGIQNNSGDNTAHFAHLGGMIFGYFLFPGLFWHELSVSGPEAS